MQVYCLVLTLYDAPQNLPLMAVLLLGTHTLIVALQLGPFRTFLVEGIIRCDTCRTASSCGLCKVPRTQGMLNIAHNYD